MTIERYYIDTAGNDDQAYSEAINFACQLSLKNEAVKKVILLLATKSSNGWFERIFKNSDVPKRLFTGVRFTDCDALFKHETVNTFRDNYGAPDTVVIACGINSEDLFKIDDYKNIVAIAVIPWVKENTIDWIKTWGAKELRGKEQDIYPDPAPAVIKAMISLTNSVNMSTSLTHPSDEALAKTYILALHKYESALDAAIVTAYLKRKLGWDSHAANKIYNLIDILNNGKFFRGGQRTGLKQIYSNWVK